MSDEVPEADAQEQRTPAWPAQTGPAGPRPPEAPEADYLEQQVPLQGGEGTSPSIADAEGPEADLLEQATALPEDEDEEYPPLPGREAEE